jgi:Transcription factor WhiB
VPPDSFSAAEVVWQASASCIGAPFDFAPDTEDTKELEYVRGAFCNMCPVRTECLAYALLYRMSGYWGGTDTATRRLLGYARNRVRCPSCKSKALIRTPEGHEVCQGCGISWRSESSHRLEEAVG